MAETKRVEEEYYAEKVKVLRVLNSLTVTLFYWRHYDSPPPRYTP